MIWFEYKYKTLENIVNNSRLITELPVVEMITLIVTIIIALFMINYFVPLILIAWEYKKELYDKRKKKQLLKQIIFQKEIENEIEEEIKREEQNN